MSSWQNLSAQCHPKVGEVVIIRLANGDQKHCLVTKCQVSERVFEMVFTYYEHRDFRFPDFWNERKVAMWKYPPGSTGNAPKDPHSEPDNDPVNAYEHEPEPAECY